MKELREKATEKEKLDDIINGIEADYKEKKEIYDNLKEKFQL